MEGSGVANRVTLATVTRIEPNFRDKLLYVYGRRFLLANSTTANADVEKKSMGIIAIPLSDSNPDADAALKECANLAKMALASSVGFRISGGVAVGGATILSHKDLSPTHCLAVAGSYTDRTISGNMQNWLNTRNAPDICELVK
jgi:hypothetical protein